MEILLGPIILLNLIAVLLLLFPFLSVVAAFTRKKQLVQENSKAHDFACIITVYQNFDICRHSINSLKTQEYSNYRVYVVADACEEISGFDETENLKLLVPDKDLASKVKSIKYAVENFDRDHDAVVIFDMDNLAHPKCLQILNDYFEKGFKVVQGRRTAKNEDSAYASLDALGELYYNHTVKLVPFLLGSSSTLAGSGMAVEMKIFEAYLTLESMNTDYDQVIIGEDIILRNFVIDRGHKIAFAEGAIIYDEKVSSARQIERQRTRWLSGYFQYLPASFSLLLKGLKRTDFNQFYMGIMSVYPPLTLLILGAFLLAIVDYLFLIDFLYILLAAFSLFTFNFILVMLIANASRPVWKSLLFLPYFIFLQIKAMLKMKRARHDFLATSHSKNISIDEVMSKRGK